MNPKVNRSEAAHAPRQHPHQKSERPHAPLNPQLSKADVTAPDELRPMRLKTIARLADVSVKTVRRWIDAGLLRSFKLGGLRYVLLRDLKAFIEKQVTA